MLESVPKFVNHIEIWCAVGNISYHFTWQCRNIWQYIDSSL